MKKPFILLIDANNLAFAQYHTHKELRSETANVNTGLIHGMFTGLLRIADLFNHAPMILVWDGDGKKWRQKQCSFYKQQRNHGEDPVYADCHEQMQIVRQFVQLLR
ncbi:MAG: hypothetical protein KGI50_06540, partial [Patescibacteria group bacterium]|nr:hypothetical protein [Patescibacteria group bacterium]